MKRIQSIIPLFAVLLLLEGCTTSTNTAAYKTLGSIETSVDTSMRAWADYVIAQRNAGVNLAAKEAEVKKVYTTYRASMNAAYDARAAYISGVAGGAEKWQAALTASLGAAATIVRIIDVILPKPVARTKIQCPGGNCVVPDPVTGICPGGNCVKH